VTHQAYEKQVASFRQFLEGQDTVLRDSLVAKRDQLSAELRFEGAARLQKEIELLDHIRHTHSRFYWIITRAHAFLLLPSQEPGAAQAYLVLNGRLIQNAGNAGAVVRTAADISTFATLAQERFHQDHDVPLRPEEIDASVIIAAWLRDPDRSQGAIFPIDSPDSLHERLDEINIALKDLQCLESDIEQY
jgi:excinuclease UvrABC nuclease subunit